MSDVDWSLWLQNGILALILIYFRSWMAKEFKDIKDCLKEKVSDTTCIERSAKCNARLDERKETADHTTEELWAIMNRHGHKGLEGDGNKVTMP